MSLVWNNEFEYQTDLTVRLKNDQNARKKQNKRE